MDEKEALKQIRFAVDKTWYDRDSLLRTVEEIEKILIKAGFPEQKVNKWDYGSPPL